MVLCELTPVCALDQMTCSSCGDVLGVVLVYLGCLLMGSAVAAGTENEQVWA
jgi:hypothetical protein